MTTAIFKPENIIKSESYCVDALTGPLVDFLSINPRSKGLGKHAGMKDLRVWQAHFRSMRVPFAVCRHSKTTWKLWKKLNVPYALKDAYRSKGVNGETIEVKCPKCDKQYTRFENWKGNGQPRFFCPACDLYLGRRRGGLDEAGIYHKGAAFNHSQGRS